MAQLTIGDGQGDGVGTGCGISVRGYGSSAGAAIAKVPVIRKGVAVGIGAARAIETYVLTYRTA